MVFLRFLNVRSRSWHVCFYNNFVEIVTMFGYGGVQGAGELQSGSPKLGQVGCILIVLQFLTEMVILG